MNIQIMAILFLWMNMSTTGPDHVKEQLKPTASNIIYYSLDEGKTWQDGSDGLPAKLDVRGFYVDNNVILLGHEHGLYRKSLNTCGAVWKQDFLVDQPIFRFFPGKGGFYATSTHNSLIQELSGSGVWRPVYTGMNAKLVQSVLETPDGNVFLGCKDGIFKSADGGYNWKQVYDGEMVFNLIFDGNSIYAGGACGFLKSTDKGEHWTTLISKENFVSKIAVINNRLFIISNRQGSWSDNTTNPDYTNRISCSNDNGVSWQRIDENLSMVRFISANENRSPIRQINDFEQLGKTLLCSLDNGLYRSSDGGKSWKLILTAPANKVYKLEISGDVIYAITVFSGC